MVRVLDAPASSSSKWTGDQPDPGTSKAPWRVYNIGNNSPVELMDYIRALEGALGVKATVDLLPLQPGDVPDTYANIDDLKDTFGFSPRTEIQNGIDRFIDWYRDYYRY